MRALVVGGDGLIGRALTHALTAAGHRWTVTTRRCAALGMQHLDLATLEGLGTLPRVDVVYLCAAITHHLDRYGEPLVRRINVDSLLAVAEHCGAHVVFPSSNAVFDGAWPMRTEDELPCPTTLYGDCKAKVEDALLARGRAGVLRITKVLESHRDLLTGWADALLAGRPIAPISDMTIAPVALRHVTDLLVAMGEQRATGVFHCSGAQDVTYADVGYHLADTLGAGAHQVCPRTRAEAGIPDSGWGAYSCLSTDRLSLLGAYRAPTLSEAVFKAFGFARSEAEVA